MKITWKKVSAAVVAFFGIGALTACYGMPPQEDADNPYFVYGHVNTVNADGETLAVKKARLSITINGVQYNDYTDEKGFYRFNLPVNPDGSYIVFKDAEGTLKEDSTKVTLTSGEMGVLVDKVLEK